MPDIKEKQPIKIIAKERKTTAPKAPIRRGVKPVVAKTKQQIIEASRGAETEEQESQQNTLEKPTVPRPHEAKKRKESKTEPKTRNYIENLQHQQNQQRNVPKAVHNKHYADSVDIKPKMRVETEPVTIPQQGSQALAEFQGRNAARKKMVQKRVAWNKTTLTDPESRGVSPAPKEVKITETRHTDGKSVCRTPAKQIKTRTNPTEKRPTDLKSVGGARKAKTKTGKVPKEKASVKSIKASPPSQPRHP